MSAARPSHSNVLDVLDAIESVDDRAWIGNRDKAPLLIAVLIDQADYTLQEQATVRRVLGLPDIGRVA